MNPRSSGASRKETLLKRSVEFKRRIRAVKIVLAFGAVVFLIVGGFVVFNLSSLSITQVSVDGAHTVSAEKISRAVAESLKGSYLYLIPKRSLLFFPRAQVREAVLAISPRIGEVALIIHRGTLVVQVKERAPAALWCEKDSVFGGTVPQCFSLDIDGFAFGLSPYAKSGAYIIFQTSDREPNIESYIMESGTFGSLFTFVKTFPLPLSRVVVDKNLRYTLYTQEGLAIFINPRIPFDQSRSLVLTALSSEALASSTRAGKEVEYLDVRVPEKAFYKLKE